VHQERFVAARGFLRLLFAHYLGASPAAVSFTYSSQGKPALDSPSPAFSFNLAHSEDVAVCALTLRNAVGVDVERIRTNFDLDQLAEASFSSYEVAALRSLPEQERVEAFFRCWTRKEAYIKARGEGLAIPLRDFDVSLTPNEPALLLASREDPAAAQRWQLHDLSVRAGYAGALAVEGGAHRLSCRAWSWDEALAGLSKP
jgi:4'-phosphopantetheinyl transferase